MFSAVWTLTAAGAIVAAGRQAAVLSANDFG